MYFQLIVIDLEISTVASTVPVYFDKKCYQHLAGNCIEYVGQLCIGNYNHREDNKRNCLVALAGCTTSLCSISGHSMLNLYWMIKINVEQTFRFNYADSLYMYPLIQPQKIFFYVHQSVERHSFWTQYFCIIMTADVVVSLVSSWSCDVRGVTCSSI